jgi:large subunit ribosomal protein L15
MKLDELRPAPGATHRRKIVGRGPASGQGKTAGKGNKGHNARSGGGKGGGFEGGQMPLYRRLPKRGFVPYGGRPEYAVVNLKALGGFAAGAVVDPAALAQAGLIKGRHRSRVKILGEGDVAHGLTVKAHAVSASARAKIEAKGGHVEVLGARVEAAS